MAKYKVLGGIFLNCSGCSLRWNPKTLKGWIEPSPGIPKNQRN